MRFQVSHKTTYTYSAPVVLGRHRLMLRPRDSHDLRLVSADLRIFPQAQLTWHHDVFGNSIAYAAFNGETDRLEIESVLSLERYARTPTTFELHSDSKTFPPLLSTDLKTDLGAELLPAYPDDVALIDVWLENVMGPSARFGAPTLDVLSTINSAIHTGFRYEAREAEGTQQPSETINRGAGTCRDYALLMMEVARRLGFGARFVTGYLNTPIVDGYDGAAASHAWAHIYVPGAGWIAYDPTNGLVESPDLIRVATVRAPHQAIPISGSYTGTAQTSLEVAVNVSL